MKRTYKDGTIIWYNSSGRRHRINAPAIQYTSGTEKWFVNGILHRLNGYATTVNINKVDSIKSMVLNGDSHCINGCPAIQHTSGTKAWYINGTNYSEADYNRILKIP